MINARPASAKISIWPRVNFYSDVDQNWKSAYLFVLAKGKVRSRPWQLDQNILSAQKQFERLCFF